MNHLRELDAIFQSEPNKRTAHARAADVLTAMSYDPAFFTEAVRKHLRRPGVLNTKHYPVVAIPIARTKHYELIANCWIPLPTRATNLSTKAIHHHGRMILTTVTSFGPGYEHWLFDRPRRIDGDLFAATLVDRSPHRPHVPAFVESYVAHCPFYPSSLSITLALWSSEDETTWMDTLKQYKSIQRHRDTLIAGARKLGIVQRLPINVIEYFDFFPVEGGLQVIKDRVEFGRGPNSHYLMSLFHILQETGNAGLAEEIRYRLDIESEIENRPLVERLLQSLERGVPIEPKLSKGHYDMPRSNFTADQVTSVVSSAGR